jgi:hypothetical protein
MTPLDMLWLPILCSSVLVFFISAVINMAPLWHKNDYPRREDQDGILNALAPFTIAPGEYLLPRAKDRNDMQSPEYKEKLAKGPVMMMTVWKYGSTPMALTFFYWFFYTVVIGIFAAYIAGRALPPGAPYLSVFRFTGAVAFLGYSAALWQFTIWFSKPWTATAKMTFDGVIYALLTAGMFGWLWPA